MTHYKQASQQNEQSDLGKFGMPYKFEPQHNAIAQKPRHEPKFIPYECDLDCSMRGFVTNVSVATSSAMFIPGNETCAKAAVIHHDFFTTFGKTGSHGTP